MVTVFSVMGKHEGSKVLDTEPLTAFCASCKQVSKDNVKLSTIANHDTVCKINHTGSAGAMEAVGATSIFQRSVSTYGLWYTQYLGEGDSKAYKTVCDSKVYGSFSIEKLECTGHIQKRMGKALINLVSDNRAKVFTIDRQGKHLNKAIVNKTRDEKKVIGISGNGKQIKRIQGHFGDAVRENDSTESMKKYI